MNSEGTIASIGGGATWIDAYLHLETLGLAVAGGRNAAVGVGGLTLGGDIPIRFQRENSSNRPQQVASHISDLELVGFVTMLSTSK